MKSYISIHVNLSKLLYGRIFPLPTRKGFFFFVNDTFSREMLKDKCKYIKIVKYLILKILYICNHFKFLWQPVCNYNLCCCVQETFMFDYYNTRRVYRLCHFWKSNFISKLSLYKHTKLFCLVWICINPS